MKPISSNQISVIIQGPLFRDGSSEEEGDLLQRAVNSIQRHLPQAEIIISTWKNQDVHGIMGTTIIQSDEPEAFIDCMGSLNNINRQIASTLTGLQAATRPYALKFRADHYLSNANIAQIDSQNLKFSQHFFFTEPITLTNYFIRNPIKLPYLFHISDIIMFGRKDDLLNLWKQPFITESELIMSKSERFKILGNFRAFTQMRHVPEQSLLLGWLAKQGIKIHLPYSCYTSWPLFNLWEKILISNFRVLNHESSGIIFPRRFKKEPIKNSLYTENQLKHIENIMGTLKYRIRYALLLFNQYCLAWFRIYYLSRIASVILFTFCPSLAKKLMHYCHKRKKVNLIHKLRAF